ncbi:MAG TPA: TPM domain-containing protein [Bacteroidia bacterium]|nr:TPM domain-containing protein [Bacteroidia bacterium]
MEAKDFFTEEQKQRIQQAIVGAELNTSGEIRVHIDKACKVHVLDQAANVFHQLKMDATALRNGILFYLAIEDRKFAILGDKGINEKVPADFWDQIKETMLDYFKKQQFTEGLSKGIEMAGEKLKRYFPIQEDDTNELSNEMSFEK